MALLEVKDRVQWMLTGFVGRVEIDPDGDLMFEYESAMVYVAVHEWEAVDATTVRVASVVLLEVPGSPALFEEIATSALDFRFGALGLFKREDGTYNVNFAQTLLGDTLDPDELRHAVGAVAFSADQLDDELKAKYGGKRWADLPAG